MTLAGFIAAENAKPFEWNVTDCASRVDRWAVAQTGISPKALSGWDGCECRGLAMLRMIRRGMGGFTKTKEPRAGDVGLAVMHGRVAASIFTGSAWIAWDEHGMMMHRAPRVMTAWRV